MSTHSNPANRLSQRQWIWLIAVILTGAVLAMLLANKAASPAADAGHQGHAEHGEHDAIQAELPGSDHAHAPGPTPQARGPHAGKLFSKGDYSLEVVIFEQNVPPEFRIYTYLNGKPLPAQDTSLAVVLQRLGREAQTIGFIAEDDYLKGQAVIEEPHSFEVTLHASHAGKHYDFHYTQLEGRVSMSDKQLQNNAIEVLKAGPARISTNLQLIGEIKLDADKTVHVVPRLSGVVESVAVNAGDSVRKGQVLAVLSSQALADQRSELLAAQKRLMLARTTFQREKTLWEEKISAEQDYLQARNVMMQEEIAVESARQKLRALGADVSDNSSQLTRYTLRAPLDGMVTDKQIAVGQVVREETSVFVVADLSSVWAEMTVYAKDIDTLALGQQVTVRSSATATEQVGKIRYIGSLLGTSSRTASARVVLPNPQRAWRPGMSVNMTLVAEEKEVPLAVSVEALQNLRDWKVVFVRHGDAFEARPLQLGRADAQHVEVLSGLLPGEAYAAGNSFLIKAELGKAGATHDH